MSPRHPKAARLRASASVMAIMLIALGAILMAAIFAQLSTSTTAVGNEESLARAQAAAESGLGILRHRIAEITNAQRLKGRNDGVLLNDLADKLRGNLASTVATATDNNGIAHITIDRVALTDGSSFSAEIWLSQRPKATFSLHVAGANRGASRQVGLELEKSGTMTVSAMDFPMASKSSIILGSAATNVYEYGNPSVEVKRPPTRLENSANGSDSYVLQWETDARDLSDLMVAFPDAPPQSFYDAIDSYVGPGTGTIDKTITVDGRTLSVRRYGGGGTETLTGSFSGLIYVEWGTSLTITGDTSLRGMIVFERRNGASGASALAFERDCGFTMDFDNAAARGILGNAWDPNADYARYNWAILAPDTTFDTSKNQKSAKIINNGSVWISEAGNNGNWKLPFAINGGTMLLEGPYESRGTFDLQIGTASGSGGGNTPVGYNVFADSASYWEY